MNDLQTAAQQALAFIRWTQFGECRTAGWDGPPPTATETEAAIKAALYAAPPRCSNCASLEAQNTELDRRLAEMEQQPAPEPVAWLSRDDARLALWEAINKREFGNPKDDKLILKHLREHGLWIGRINTAPPQRKPPATIDQLFDRMNKAPRGVFYGHDPMTIWMEAWRAAEQHHGIGRQTDPQITLAEPAPEPVAWIHTDACNPKVRFLEWTQQAKGYRGDWIKTPLYTAPPKAEPLTDEEIDRITDAQWASNNHKPIYAAHRAYARAVEAAHGIIDSGIQGDKA